MNSKILADESVSGIIIRDLRQSGLDLDAIIELNPGIPDSEVIQIAKDNSSILITEDKDFGEWVFAHKVRGLSVIFVRYMHGDQVDISAAIQQILANKESYPLDTNHYFVTITKQKVRARKL